MVVPDISPIAKLPVGLPPRVWGDIRRALFHQHNFVYYGLLVTLWLIVFIGLFAPGILEISITTLGIGWGLALGYLFQKREN